MKLVKLTVFSTHRETWTLTLLELELKSNVSAIPPYVHLFDFSQFTLEWYKFYIFISMFVNISAEYSLEKKENRCYLRARTSTHRLHSHWHVNLSNMSLYAIHLISLAQPHIRFERNDLLFTRQLLYQLS